MRFLHVSLSSVRMMDTYTRMIRSNFPEEEHRFLYCDEVGGEDRRLLEYGNSKEVMGSLRQRFRTICEEFDAADYIIWHGLMSGAKRVLIPLLFRKYMRKSVWVIRGIDLYNWRKQERGPKSWAINFVNYHGRKNMPYVCVIFEPDEEVYHQQFGQRAKVFYTPYPLSENAFASMESLRGRAPRANGKVYIQVQPPSGAAGRAGAVPGREHPRGAALELRQRLVQPGERVRGEGAETGRRLFRR